MIILGQRLRDARKKLGKTQLEVSSDLQIPRGTYAQYEIGKRNPELSTMIRIANYFKCSIDYFVKSYATGTIYFGAIEWNPILFADLLDKAIAEGLSSKDFDIYSDEATEYMSSCLALDDDSINSYRQAENYNIPEPDLLARIVAFSNYKVRFSDLTDIYPPGWQEHLCEDSSDSEIGNSYKSTERPYLSEFFTRYSEWKEAMDLAINYGLDAESLIRLLKGFHALKK